MDSPTQLAALLIRLPAAHVIELGPGKGYAVVRLRSGATKPAGEAVHRCLALCLQLLAARLAALPPLQLQQYMQQNTQQAQQPPPQPLQQPLGSPSRKWPASEPAGAAGPAAKRARRGAGSCPGQHLAEALAATCMHGAWRRAAWCRTCLCL